MTVGSKFNIGVQLKKQTTTESVKSIINIKNIDLVQHFDSLDQIQLCDLVVKFFREYSMSPDDTDPLKDKDVNE